MEAVQYGIQLVPFCCWEDAEKALVSDFKRWSAIVLDAKCKYKHDSHDNASVFLTQAMYSITKICNERHRVLPWYVLSGGSEDELNDLIIDSREEWDGDWKEKKFYSKTTDRDLLFHRIPYHARVSPEMQIRLVYYPDVFKAIRNSGLNSDVEVYMEELLLPIHTLGCTGKEYNDNMTKIRKCIEFVFQSMARNGILPNQKRDSKYVIHDILMDKRGGINTAWCNRILCGELTSDNKWTITSEKILPNVLKDSFKRLIEISAAYEHADNNMATKEQKKNSRHTSEFLANIDNAPYLLRSMTMELCNMILWYDHYLDNHKDEEMNALNWNVVEN